MGLSAEAKEEMKTVFSSFDKDGSGTVSASELARGMSRVEGGLTEEQCIELVNLGDNDGDRQMDLEEFIAIVEEGFSLLETEDEGVDLIAEEFSNFDLNGDGFIDRDELKAAMVEMGEELDEVELEQMFKAADADGDEKITLAEFKDMCGR